MNGARRGQDWAVAGVLMLAVAGSLAWARPAEPPPGDRAQEPADAAPPPEDGEALPRGGRPWMRDGLPRQLLDLPPKERRARFREFLESRRVRMDRIEAALGEAIKSLDEGSAIEEVIERFPAELRSDLRPSPGNGRGWGGGGGAGGGREGELKNLNDLGPVAPPGDGPMSPGEGRGPGPRAGEREPRGEITEADRAVFDEFLGSAAPRVQGLMRELRKRDPERADRKIHESMPRMRWLIELRERDREMYDLRLRDIRAGREAFEAARNVADFDRDHPDRSSSPEREHLAEQLRTALRTQYDVRGQILAHEIARMESDLSMRREELSKRGEGKTPIVDRMADRLIERLKERRPVDRRSDPDGEGEAPGDDGAPPPPR